MKSLFETASQDSAARHQSPSQAAPQNSGRFPSWLHIKLPQGGELFKTNALLKANRLSLVCEEAKCPNRLECYSRKTATFLALGKACTRNCGFCDISYHKTPPLPDPGEPGRIASSAKALGLAHVVITMVARDDLPDGGAVHLAEILRALRRELPKATVETLASDFAGNLDALYILLRERPDVFNHNVETVPSLTPRIRHRATYERSLHVLREAKQSGLCRKVKSGLMVGLGESEEELCRTLDDLKSAGCDSVTIGQYLQPRLRKLLVKRFVAPEEFKALELYGLSIGIPQVLAGPLVRSSYHADKLL